MNIVYNNFDEISTSLSNSFLNLSNNLSKPQAKNLAYAIVAATDANSIVTSTVASHFKGSLSFNKPESNERKLRRFLNNFHFSPYIVYQDFINHILSNYKVKHLDNSIFISFDHSFNKDDFVSLVVALRIGKQSIPIWFRCFKSDDKTAFNYEIIKDALTFAHESFPDKKIVFLADRFFNDVAIFNLIDEFGDTYYIWTKTNVNVSFNGTDFVSLSSISSKVHNSKIIDNVYFTSTNKKLVNIVISPSKDTDDPWYIITNGNPKMAIKHYSKRFGGIEFIFKAQKSNGYSLEKTTTRNLTVFTKLFFISCVAILWLTILGADYVKNKNKKSVVNLYDVKNVKGKKIRIKSLFTIGKQLFQYAYDSYVYYKLKYDFILYDL